jgi:hypothetical protein
VSGARSRFRLSRLRAGEWIAGVSGLALLVLTLAAPWYGTTRPLSRTAALLLPSTSFTGWSALSHIRWLILVTALAGLALFCAQALCRAPAIPSTLSMIAMVLSLASVVVLIYRVLIAIPGPSSVLEQKAGAYLGLASALALLYGGFRSLREEGIAPEDGPQEIPVVRLGSPSRST